jgi:hypothetical protein
MTYITYVDTLVPIFIIIIIFLKKEKKYGSIGLIVIVYQIKQSSCPRLILPDL